MTNNSKKSSTPTWVWVFIAIIVAALTVGCLIYIGWFDGETHVDTPAGDNVLEQYELTEPNADAPGEANWQNADHRSLQDVIVDPEGGEAN